MATTQAGNAKLRAQHWREFMEEVLDISPDTPLADVLPQAIMKAAKAHYAAILSQAACEAQALALLAVQSKLQTPTPVAAAIPSPAPRPQFSSITPHAVRLQIDRAINAIGWPNLIDLVRFTGEQGVTNSMNYRMDFSHWTFGPHPKTEGSVNNTLDGSLERCLRSIQGIDLVGAQIMSYANPVVVRMTFRNSAKGSLFHKALQIKSQGHSLQSITAARYQYQNNLQNLTYAPPQASPHTNQKTDDYCHHSTSAPRIASDYYPTRFGINQYPARSSGEQYSARASGDIYPAQTSYQAGASALIDSYRPSADSKRLRQDPIRSNPLKPIVRLPPTTEQIKQYPAERPLRDQSHSAERLREYGRLSPIRGMKREYSSAEKVEGEEEGEIRGKDMVGPQVKRLRATDFIDMDHYP